MKEVTERVNRLKRERCLFKTRLKIVQCAEVGKTPRFLSNISPTQVM